MKVRAKFKVDGIKQVAWSQQARVVELSAVSADDTPENERYHKYTPSGAINLTIDNPPAADFFELGKTYYLDFTIAE